MLSMADALRLFRAQGLDVLIAEAAVRSAEGDVEASRARCPIPVGSAAYGPRSTTTRPGCDAVLRELLGGRCSPIRPRSRTRCPASADCA